MAEDFVSYDKYRADLADFRADMARFREEVRAELGSMRRDFTADISSLKGENASIRQEMYRLHAQTIVWLASLVATGVALTVTLIKLIP